MGAGARLLQPARQDRPSAARSARADRDRRARNVGRQRRPLADHPAQRARRSPRAVLNLARHGGPGAAGGPAHSPSRQARQLAEHDGAHRDLGPRAGRPASRPPAGDRRCQARQARGAYRPRSPVPREFPTPARPAGPARVADRRSSNRSLGEIGIEVIGIPSASSIAAANTAALGITPASPAPLTPSGLSGDGVSRWSISIRSGTSLT